MRARVLLAGLYHETHCFTDDITGLASFRIRHGAELPARRGDASTTDGFLSVAEREGWQVVPTADYSATPSGRIDHTVFEAFWKDVEPVLARALAEGLNGIFLALHGAMVTTAEEDPEGELLRRIRAMPGAATVPIAGCLDMHGNLTPAMCAAEALVCYRETPHIDGFETAARAADLLARCINTGRRPRMRWRGTPILLPPTGTATADEPLRSLEALAREAEQQHRSIWAIDVMTGFAFADIHQAGMAFGAITEDDALADAVLDRLAALAWSLKEKGIPAEDDPDEVLARILPVKKGPVLLLEPADNIGGGAPGDCTDILRALLRHGAKDAGVILNDPIAVAALQEVPIGGAVRLALGGRGSRLDLGPVDLDVTLVSRSDGRFTLEDPHSHLASMVGLYVDMGASAVVRHGGITILLTTLPTPPFDLGQWRSQGIDPERFAIIGVKAAVAHRRAYDPIAAASFTLRTRGPCTSDLSALPYARLRRPMFPLDPEATLD